MIASFLSAAAGDFTSPTIDYHALAPEIVMAVGICVVLLSQLNRSVEGRDDKRPTMADLRDSGDIEAHADAVGLLYRPVYYLQRSAKVKHGDPVAMAEVTDKQYDLEINLDKNRLGPATTIRLYCNVAFSCVDNLRTY